MESNAIVDFLCKIAIYGKLTDFHSYCTDVTELQKTDPHYGKTWMFFPDGDGFPQIISLNNDGTATKLTNAHEDPESKIKIWLYNKYFDTPEPLIKMSKSSNRETFSVHENFDKNEKTKIIIHGWKNDLNSSMMQTIINAYLNEPEDYNIIAVDWGEMAQDNNYLKCVSDTRNVGYIVAKVIDNLVHRRKARLEDFHIIGHSLGAHTAGFAGMFTQNFRNKRVGRITGLDPAYPGFFDANKLNETLDSTDADFVDVIHTCAGTLGHTENLGDADFFPNNGRSRQPGCTLQNDFVGACSHGRSYQYFAESISTKNGFMSFFCDSWESFLDKNCTEDPIPMGEATPKTAQGTFFLETSEGPRFSRFIKIF